jgi:hypothetical protein
MHEGAQMGVHAEPGLDLGVVVGAGTKRREVGVTVAYRLLELLRG